MGRGVNTAGAMPMMAPLPLRPGVPTLSGRFEIVKLDNWQIRDTQQNDKLVGYGFWGKRQAESAVLFLDKQVEAGQTKLVVASAPDFTSRTRYCTLCGANHWCKCPDAPAARRRHAGELADIDRQILEILLAHKNNHANTAKFGLEPMSFASQLVLPSSVCRQRLRSLFNRELVTGHTIGGHSWGAIKQASYVLTDKGEAALKSGLV